ncbi:hypothetical protein HY496_00940 [Candidatus Woesearchaeota archaeon]|nr:hypothetical protein [Candidatus Woesearchaeota archaeon]
MNPTTLKVIGYAVMIILVLNLLLFAFRVISGLVFWIVIICGAVFVYFVLPKMRGSGV